MLHTLRSQLRRGLLLLSLPVLLTLAACDRCQDKVCLNGGSCFDGDCSCVYPFEGAQCEKLEREKFVGRYDITYRGKVTKKSLAAPEDYSHFDITMRNQFVAADPSNNRVVLPDFLGTSGQSARMAVYGSQLRVDSDAFYNIVVDGTSFRVRFAFSGNGTLQGKSVTIATSSLPSFEYDGYDIEIILNKLD